MIGGRTGRLATAGALGAATMLNYHQLEGDLADKVARVCGQRFPNVVEASGTEMAMGASLRLASPQGRVLVIGDYGQARADFEWNHLLHEELELIGSCASAHAWPEAVRLAASGEVPLHRLVTHRLPATRYEDGMELVRSHRDDAIKVVLEWPHATR